MFPCLAYVCLILDCFRVLNVCCLAWPYACLLDYSLGLSVDVIVCWWSTLPVWPRLLKKNKASIQIHNSGVMTPTLQLWCLNSQLKWLILVYEKCQRILILVIYRLCHNNYLVGIDISNNFNISASLVFHLNLKS